MAKGESGDGSSEAGVFGREIGANMPPAPAVELSGRFVQVFGGTAVAVAASLNRPLADAAYNSRSRA